MYVRPRYPNERDRSDDSDKNGGKDELVPRLFVELANKNWQGRAKAKTTEEQRHVARVFRTVET